MKAMVPSLLAAAAIGLCNGASASAQTIPSGNIDHLICYRFDDKLKPDFAVDMVAEIQPDFTKKGCKILKPMEFCVPASKVNVAPAPPIPGIIGQTLRDDYICYAMKCPDDTRVADRTIVDQFGSRAARKFRVDKVCVPARKSSPPCGQLLAGARTCGGGCPTPEQKCDYDPDVKQCVCGPTPCGGKPDKAGMCGGQCADPAQQCRPTANNECGCQPPPPPCGLLLASLAVCGGACPNPTDACALNTDGKCVCQPPPPSCALNAANGQCGGACLSPSETCDFNSLGLCVCQPPRVGPIVTTVGVADPDGTIVDPDAVDPNGIPIYTRPTGFSFLLFAEFKKGPNNIPIGEAGTQGQEFPGPEAPDFQGLVDMPLGVPPGLGSAQVCDDGIPAGEENGGVPVATGFGDINPLKDLACRFAVLDVSGEACTVNGFGNFAFASPQTFKQFCAMIGLNLKFQSGDTKVRMRAANTAGDTGDEGVVIIRVP
jgi:hypothetical protein